MSRFNRTDALADDSSKEWIWVKVQQHDLEDLGLMADEMLVPHDEKEKITF
jgi:hypothetical protein